MRWLSRCTSLYSPVQLAPLPGTRIFGAPCTAWCLFDFRPRFSPTRGSWDCVWPKSGYYNSPMHSAGQICSTPTQTHSRNLKSACHPSLSSNVPMIPAVCWSHNLAYIHLLHKTFNNTEKQTDKKGKGSASVGISGQICGLSQWKSCCKIMLISPSLRKERGLIQKKNAFLYSFFFFFFF